MIQNHKRLVFFSPRNGEGKGLVPFQGRALDFCHQYAVTGIYKGNGFPFAQGKVCRKALACRERNQDE